MDLFEEYPELRTVEPLPLKFDDDWVPSYDFANCLTVVEPDGPYSVRDVAAAIIVFRGNYAEIAKALGRRREGVRGVIARNGDLARLHAEVYQEFLDEVESGFMRTALMGDKDAMKFVLQTRGKDRGYTTRTEQTGANGGPIEVAAQTIDWSQIPIEEREQFAQRLANALRDQSQPKDE